MNSAITLEQALGLDYRFNVIAQAEGGFVIQFPDLPGCMTQVDDIGDVSAAAEEIRTLWLETAHDLGQSLPAPAYPEEFSGKFNVRIPKSLHRDLAFRAADEGVSLNQLVVSILSNRAIWPHAPERTIESQETRNQVPSSEKWRHITEFSEVEVELADSQETVLGKWDAHSSGTGRFGNETTITRSKVVPFGPRRRAVSDDGDDGGIKRAI
jgi:antitoxin HicB